MTVIQGGSVMGCSVSEQVRDEIDELVDWQLQRAGSGVWPRPMFELLPADFDEAGDLATARWSQEEGWWG
ncbi:hypothetical protein SEA_SCHOOLBUS_111 [Mycobacterium phage SchoolBus]|nr:hypothetical protein SEA_JANGDYNASTY_108 [Mycobacterium phage JangDynasty]AVP42766.1 hypothetical protein SEA_SCHOOLBUS_111 [Mycobacterium phage SchoolBus]QGJ87430.1 hypothetical protein SEA_BLESSICA_110 [Mycobacterium phage Blessica]URM87885.1 hypothetical protein SEA_IDERGOLLASPER_114 [Mycobacterium phage Idergollasper]